jgi:hypothetical protein
MQSDKPSFHGFLIRTWQKGTITFLYCLNSKHTKASLGMQETYSVFLEEGKDKLMNRVFKLSILPCLMASSVVGTTLLPYRPAAADDHILKDVGIGAAAGVVSGAILHHGNILTNGVNGAASGAAVNAANGGRRSSHKNRSLVQDLGVGAAGSTVSGAIIHRGNPVKDGIGGAAAGAAVNILDHNR